MTFNEETNNETNQEEVINEEEVAVEETAEETISEEETPEQAPAEEVAEEEAPEETPVEAPAMVDYLSSDILNVRSVSKEEIMETDDEEKFERKFKLSANTLVDKIESKFEINSIHKGTVKNLTQFGAFVELEEGIDGLVHVSEIAEERVEKVSDYFVEGEEVQVKVLDVDRQGKIKLTMKGLDD